MIGIWLDQRIGGCPRLTLCDDDGLMRIPDEIRDCVCFLTAVRGPGQSEVGSGFFVGVTLGCDDRTVVYVVTARHCIESADFGMADDVVLRINLKSGGSEELHTDPARWVLHPTADVAILFLEGSDPGFLIRCWPLASCATEAVVRDRNIGPGDDAFVTGLLVHHPGVTRNMPIVRLGCIAALPEDPVALTTGDDIVALLEVRSIGGISGSPVFAHLPFWRDSEKGDMWVGGGGKATSGGENWLLGVMHGFYPVGINDPDGVSAGNEDLNTGIAVVALVDRVLDLVNSPTEVAKREAIRTILEASRMPKPTSTKTESSEFNKFEDLAREIVQVPKSEIDEQRAQTD